MDISPRLSAILDRALEYRITEIIAPAGFGKSTVLLEMARKRDFRIASIRSDEDAVLALMRALCQAVSPELPDLLLALPDAFENASESNKSELGSWFAQSLRGRGYRIAVDDLHHLGNDDTAWAMLSDLVEFSIKDGSQWILASRTWPKVPTVQWTARGEEGVPIDERDLAMSADDAQYVAASIGVTLSSDDASRINAITRGWPLLSIYALRLLERGSGFAELVETIAGRGVAAIADHLLARLNTEEIGTLLAVAIQDGALPEELEMGNRGDAQRVSSLAVAGLPIIQGGDRRWRVHDVLREHLLVRDPEKRVAAADKMALALERRENLDRALRVSLSAGSPDTVRGLLERNVRYFIDAGDPQLLRSALVLFSHRMVQQSPQLALLRGLEEMLRGESQMAVGFLKRAVEISQGSFKTYALARLLQGLFNCEGYAEEASAVATELTNAPRPIEAEEACEVLGYLAQAFTILGKFRPARDAIRSALDLLPRLSDAMIEARTYLRAGRVALVCGCFDEAESFAIRAIAIGERHRLFETLFWAFQLRLNAVAPDRESNAVEYAREASRNAARILSKAALYSAETSLMVFACRAGRVEEARELRARLLAISRNRKSRVSSLVLTNAALLEMLEGNYWKASTFLADVQGFGEAPVDGVLLSVREVIFKAHSALLQQLTGDNQAAIREARNVLEICTRLRLEGIAIAATPEIEISRIMAAAILGANGIMPQAESTLDDLARNANEQYRRDLAVWTIAALSDRNAKPSDAAIEHAKGIVELIRRAIAQVEQAPLTPTERQVLESVALGRSSKEIAAFTGKSVKTIDNHVAAILRKLQAHSRGEAVARARRAGLLSDEQDETIKA